jgi:hypothetical protein
MLVLNLGSLLIKSANANALLRGFDLFMVPDDVERCSELRDAGVGLVVEWGHDLVVEITQQID